MLLLRHFRVRSGMHSLIRARCSRSTPFPSTFDQLHPPVRPPTPGAAHSDVIVALFIFPPLNADLHELTRSLARSLAHSLAHSHTLTHPHSPAAGWGIRGLRLTKTLMCGAAAERKQRGRTRCEETQQSEEERAKPQQGD